MSKHCMGPPRTSVAALTVPPAIAACVALCAIFPPRGYPRPPGKTRPLWEPFRPPFYASAVCTICPSERAEIGGRKQCGIKQVVAFAPLRLTTPRSAGRLSILPGSRFEKLKAAQGGRNRAENQGKPEVATVSQVTGWGGYYNFGGVLR